MYASCVAEWLHFRAIVAMNSGSLFRCCALSVPQIARALFLWRFLHIRCSRPLVGKSTVLYIVATTLLPLEIPLFRIARVDKRASVLKNSSSWGRYHVLLCWSSIGTIEVCATVSTTSFSENDTRRGCISFISSLKTCDDGTVDVF